MKEKGGGRFSGPSFIQRDNRSGRNICFYRKKLTMTKSHLFSARFFFAQIHLGHIFFSILRRPRQIRFTHVFPFASAAISWPYLPAEAKFRRMNSYHIFFIKTHFFLVHLTEFTIIFVLFWFLFEFRGETWRISRRLTAPNT